MKSPRPFLPAMVLFILLLILAAAAYPLNPSAPPLPLIMDGHFDDWAARPPTYTDATGDAGKSGVDILEIGLAHTATHLLIHVKLNQPINLQSDRALYLTLNTDADPEPDLFYDFGNRAGAFKGRPVSQFDLGLVTLPTTSSDEFEIALALDATPNGPLFPSDSISLTLKDPTPSGGDTAPDQDTTPNTLAYALTSPAEPDLPPIALEKPDPAQIRLVTWNMLQDGMFDKTRTPAFQRILTALQPDVIAFQEVYNRTAKSVQVKFEDWLGAPWYTVQVGDLVLASRTPFVEDWVDTYKPLTAGRTFPVMLDFNGSKFILFDAHLSCCDANAERQEQVDRVIAFLRDAQLPPNIPIIFVGDLNLVGDAAQLNTLLTGNIADETQFGPDYLPDWDATPLADLTPRQTNSSFAYTWRDDRDTYAPGRLDYILYTDSVLTSAHSFVFFTGILPPDLLTQYGLEVGDSQLASDHFPVVVDFSLP